MIIAIFLSFTRNFRSSLRTQCSKIWLSIQLFFCATGQMLNIFKRAKVFRFAYIEAVVRRCSVKKVFLEISQNSQENTCARVSFLIKLMTCNFIKKETRAQVVSCEFCRKFLRTPFFVEHFWWLLLYSYIAFLPSGAFFPFEMIDFIRNTFSEEAKFISISSKLSPPNYLLKYL